MCGVERKKAARADLPDAVRAAIREHTGPSIGLSPTACGFSSQIAVTLDTRGGRVFIKGMRQDHREALTLQREAAVNPHVVPVAPRSLWRGTAGGWDLLGFEHVAGRAADYSPGV